MRGAILKYGVVIILVISSGGVLMNISQHVQRAEREIKSYDRKIAQKEEAIRVLKAEWAYLNNPSRLELLASKGLGFASPKAMDIVSDISLDDEPSSSPVFAPANHRKRSPLHRDISHSYNAPFNNAPFNNGGAQ